VGGDRRWIESLGKQIQNQIRRGVRAIAFLPKSPYSFGRKRLKARSVDVVAIAPEQWFQNPDHYGLVPPDDRLQFGQCNSR
jgi:hypothetical protein